MNAIETLRLLASAPHAVTAREMANSTGKTRTACSSMLRELTERGLCEVEQRREGAYQRVAYRITDEGRRFAHGELTTLPPSHRNRKVVVEDKFESVSADWSGLYRFAGLL